MIDNTAAGPVQTYREATRNVEGSKLSSWGRVLWPVWEPRQKDAITEEIHIALEYVLQPISVFRTILQMAVEPFLQSCCGGRDLLSAEVVRPVLFGRPEQHIGRGYGNMVAVNAIQRRCQAGQHERGMRIVVAAWNDRHNFSACYQLPKTITALVPGARFKDADPGVAKIPESFYLHVMKLH